MSTCRECRAGVYEPIGYFPIDENGNIGEFIITRFPKSSCGLILMICSREDCGNVKIKAGPATVSLAKKISREAVLHQ